jgi:hypothetical protein
MVLTINSDGYLEKDGHIFDTDDGEEFYVEPSFLYGEKIGPKTLAV